MIIIIKNQSFTALSYLSGLITVPAGDQLQVGASLTFPVSRDSQLLFDCKNNIVILNDGVNDYKGQESIAYLNQVASSIGGVVVGQAGSTAPIYEITVGGKDSAGKSQPIRLNQFADATTNFRNSFTNLVGNVSTTVKSGSGTLHGISINDNTTNGTITVYDNTAASGTKIGTFQIGSPSGGLLSTSGQPGPILIGPLGCEFSTGLTIVTTGSNSNNITVYYQ